MNQEQDKKTVFHEKVFTPYKEVDERFDKAYNEMPENFERVSPEAIKSFLHSELSRQAEEIMERLPKEENTYLKYFEVGSILENPREVLLGCKESGFNEAISKIKSLLSEYITNK